MKSHTKHHVYSLQCSPGVPPVLNWRNLAPVDWSWLPRLGSRTAELVRFANKWKAEYRELGLDPNPPTIPMLPYHAPSAKALKAMRKTCELPLEEFADWRGITRNAEDALAEFYALSRKYCVRMRGTGAATPSIGKGFFPNLKRNGYPQRELERAADYLGSREARRKPWAIGPKAAAFRGLGDEDWAWLEEKYPDDYFRNLIRDRFTRWHLNKRAEWSYDVASVRIRKSQKKDHPRPSFNLWMYNEWVRNDYNERKASSPIDIEEDPAILDERLRLEEAFEAHQL